MTDAQPKKAPSSLSLDSSEVAKLGSVARDNEFESKGVTLIYSEDPFKKLESFIKAYRYILNLTNSFVPPPQDGVAWKLKNKLTNFVQTAEPIYEQALILSDRLKRAVHFNEHRIKRNILLLLIEHRLNIGAWSTQFSLSGKSSSNTTQPGPGVLLMPIDKFIVPDAQPKEGDWYTQLTFYQMAPVTAVIKRKLIIPLLQTTKDFGLSVNLSIDNYENFLLHIFPDCKITTCYHTGTDILI